MIETESYDCYGGTMSIVGQDPCFQAAHRVVKNETEARRSGGGTGSGHDPRKAWGGGGWSHYASQWID